MENKSRKYLLSLTKEEREILATNVHSSPAYLYQIGAGLRSPSRRLVVLLERETTGQVKAVDFDNEARHAISA